MKGPLTIVWHPNIADVRYGLRSGLWGTPWRTLRSMFVFLVIPGVFFGCAFHDGTLGWVSLGESIFAGAVFGVLFAVLFLVGFTYLFAWYLVRIQRTKGDPQRIRLTEEGLERVLSDTRIRHAWSGVSRVEENARVFVLFGLCGRPLAWIEKSGIASPEELASVRAFLQSRLPGRYLGG